MPEAIESHLGCDAIEQEWDDLALRVGAWPFLRPGWIGAWWRAFGEGELDVHALRRQGRLAAVLAVASSGNRVRSPTNWHTPLYGPVAEDAGAARALLDFVLARRPRRLELSFLDRADPGLRELRALAGDYRLSERVLMRSPYLSLEGDWESYFASLSRNHRQSVRRTRRRLEEMGAVALEVVDGRERIGEALEEGFRIEASGWKGEKGQAITSTAATRGFYQEVADWASRAGILRIAFLRLDQRGIAVNISLEDPRRHYMLKTGYDPGLSSLGPGRLLTAEMIRRSFELGHESYELLGGDEPYKLRWTETSRDRVRAQLFAPTLPGHVDHLLQVRALAGARGLRGMLRR